MNRARLAKEARKAGMDPISIEAAPALPGWIVRSDVHPTWIIHLPTVAAAAGFARCCLPPDRRNHPSRLHRCTSAAKVQEAWEFWWLDNWRDLEWADLGQYLDNGGVTFINEEERQS